MIGRLQGCCSKRALPYKGEPFLLKRQLWILWVICVSPFFFFLSFAAFFFFIFFGSCEHSFPEFFGLPSVLNIFFRKVGFDVGFDGGGSLFPPGGWGGIILYIWRILFWEAFVSLVFSTLFEDF